MYHLTSTKCDDETPAEFSPLDVLLFSSWSIVPVTVSGSGLDAQGTLHPKPELVSSSEYVRVTLTPTILISSKLVIESVVISIVNV